MLLLLFLLLLLLELLFFALDDIYPLLLVFLLFCNYCFGLVCVSFVLFGLGFELRVGFWLLLELEFKFGFVFNVNMFERFLGCLFVLEVGLKLVFMLLLELVVVNLWKFAKKIYLFFYKCKNQKNIIFLL